MLDRLNFYRLDSTEHDAQHSHVAIENRLLAIEQKLDILASQLRINGYISNSKALLFWQWRCLDVLLNLCCFGMLVFAVMMGLKVLMHWFR